MNEEKQQANETLVEKWIRDQQEWQRTATEYFDSMVKNDEFLVHLGNAMRGSLLAGKPYPGTEPADDKPESTATDDRIDEILHLLHRLEGEIADLKLSMAEIAAAGSAAPAAPAAPQAQPNQFDPNQGEIAGDPEQGPS